MIQNSAMLIDLNISTWTGRKMDKKVSEEIDQAKNTKSRAGNYHKDRRCYTPMALRADATLE